MSYFFIDLQKIRIALKHVVLVCLFVGGTHAASGQDWEKTDGLHIVTPLWEKQTNEDGTGLFFEIVRSVYELAGIEMEYKIVPWKRARNMVNKNQADAMLCAWREDAQKQGQRIPEYPMFTEYTAVVFKKARIEDWKGVPSVRSKNAVWLRGYDYHTTSHLKGMQLDWTEVDRYKQAWEMLNRDRVDFYIEALIDIEQYVRDQKMDTRLWRIEILWGNNTYIAFGDSERSKKLIGIYDKNIIQLFKTGRLKAIYDKWGVRFSPDPWKKQSAAAAPAGEEKP
ncbi:hypothetical protein DENIS_0931 [Desulfonema ishimotonii]|uniref:Solute-binding protein family 3/N-terminal domain-containing protein n=1 Tax=Desulfonema ishimotonii TaxID=45657 RepID=A0A401FSP3_9BACT|nr:transporter substrate-binding domain-containing protein [Desulfonema ishimotonii]GBC59989.1 hypothetical protein DENIS_0931 [Desulfonema ishimotonii]